MTAVTLEHRLEEGWKVPWRVHGSIGGLLRVMWESKGKKERSSKEDWWLPRCGVVRRDKRGFLVLIKQLLRQEDGQLKHECICLSCLKASSEQVSRSLRLPPQLTVPSSSQHTAFCFRYSTFSVNDHVYNQGTIKGSSVTMSWPFMVIMIVIRA